MKRISRREGGKLLIACSAGFVTARRPLFGAVNAAKIVEDFWASVWQARNPEAVDQFVSEDFILTAGGIDIVSRATFKKWVAHMFEMISAFDFRVIETFQNSDGSRVASRWKITGKNNGLFDTPPNQEPIVLTGNAVWQVSPDGKLLHNWVERSMWEVYQQIKSSRRQKRE